MTLAWHVGEADRKGMSWNDADDDTRRQLRAAMFAASYGIEAYIPLQPAVRKIGHKSVEINVPRFGAYVFLRFDRDGDAWSAMLHPNAGGSRFRRLICNSSGRPITVPERVIEAVRAYRPVPVTLPQDRRYQPGERVMLNLKGIRKEAVFVEYCGNRPKVRTWIFGVERIAEVATAEIEPIEQGEAACDPR